MGVTMSKEEMIKQLQEQLSIAKLHRQSQGLSAEQIKVKKEIKTFQVARLEQTHADYLANKSTNSALIFFLKEIYAGKDLEKRDEDLARFVDKMKKVFSTDTLDIITKAVTLDAITEELDTQMAIVLKPGFSQDDYINAYFEVTSKAQREEQINLVESLGMTLSAKVKNPLLYGTLKLMRVPAAAANLSHLQDFLEGGFQAFKDTKDAKKFIQVLASREREIIANVYAKKIHPFSVN
jgi:hypothetical protein